MVCIVAREKIISSCIRHISTSRIDASIVWLLSISFALNADVCCSIPREACAAVQVKNQGDQKIVEPNTLDRTKVQNIEAGNLSNENAERRADAGAEQPFSSIQAFDGVGECPPSLLLRRLNLLWS